MTPRLRTTPATVVWVTTVLATVLACSDSTTPTIPSNLVGRYVVTAVNGKRLPQPVYATPANRAVSGYDSLSLRADTLWLLADSTAQELGAVTYKYAVTGDATPTVVQDTTTVIGTFRAWEGAVSVRTWTRTDDVLTFADGGSRMFRNVNMWPEPTATRVRFTYERRP